MGFERLRYAQDEGRAFEPILAKETAFHGQSLEDITAMKIVVQCAMLGEQFLQSKTLPTEWNTTDDLYRAYVPPRTWPNSDTPRANIPMPLILETIETLLPQTHLSFFSDTQPFLLDPKGRTSPAAARAAAKIAMWSAKMSDFEEEIRKIEKSAMQYGMGVGKWGWRLAKKRKKVYSREGEAITVREDEQDIAHPTFEFVDLRNLIVDPATRCHDIRKSGWRVFQKFINANGLDDLRNDGTYKNVPTREELAVILAEQNEPTQDSIAIAKARTWRENQAELQDKSTSPDPLKQPLELLEYEDNDRIITVLQRKIVIRNDENEERKPHYVSCSFIDVLNAFYGFGVSKLLEGEQRLQTGVANLYVDSLGLKLNPVWQRKGGIGARSQNITVGPGKVVNSDGELIPLPMESISQEALLALQASEARATRRVGANFGQNMPTQAMRTAEGVQDFTNGVQVRLQYFVNNFANLVFIPVIEAFIDLCKDNLTPQEINGILTEEEGKAFEGDILDVYNGEYCVQVLSSTKLAGRRGMQAMIPMMMQLLGQPALVNLLNVQGKKFDFAEFFNEVFDITGWPSTDLIVDMTPEDQQRMAMSNPAIVNAQAKQQQQATQQQNDLEQIQAKGEASAGVQVVRHVLKQSEPPKPVAPLANQG